MKNINLLLLLLDLVILHTLLYCCFRLVCICAVVALVNITIDIWPDESKTVCGGTMGKWPPVGKLVTVPSANNVPSIYTKQHKGVCSVRLTESDIIQVLVPLFPAGNELNLLVSYRVKLFKPQ